MIALIHATNAAVVGSLMMLQPLPSGVSVVRQVEAEAEATRDAQTIRFFDLSGTDHEGHVSMSNLKNWGSDTFALQGLPDYPYLFLPDAFNGQGVWTSLVAEPLSPVADYPEETPDTQVLNKVILDPDYHTRSAGRVSYRSDQLTGVGTEVVPPSLVSVAFDNVAFSPIYSVHNAGSGVGNAGWDYVVQIANLTGNGLTLVDGEVTSVDMTGDVIVTVRFLGTNFGALPNTYSGTVTFECNQFEFDVDVTQDNISLLGPLTDTRLVITRRGTIEAIAPCVP